MNTETNDEQSYDQAVVAFIAAFEELLGNDWDYTKSMLGIVNDPERDAEAARVIGGIFGDDEAYVRHVVSPDGTFIDPKVDDETEDWGNRAMLLDAYRHLKSLIAEREGDGKSS